MQNNNKNKHKQITISNWKKINYCKLYKTICSVLFLIINTKYLTKIKYALYVLHM